MNQLAAQYSLAPTAAPSSLREALAVAYPQVTRIARALMGRDDLAGDVVSTVMRNFIAVMDGKPIEGAPSRWFRRHTVLIVRRPTALAPDAIRDPLLWT